MTTKTALARLWRAITGGNRWPSDVDAFVDALIAKDWAAPAPSEARTTSRIALFSRAQGHPLVLEIMADCADCIDTENEAQHDPTVCPYDGSRWRAMASELRAQAAAIRAEEPDIWAATTTAPAGLTDEQIDEMLGEVDHIAREFNIYEYGLPTHSDDLKQQMRDAVRKALGYPAPRADDKGEPT